MTHSTKTQSLTEEARPKRAVIFTRARNVPRDPELDQTQLTAQVRYCGQVAEDLGAEVVSEYRTTGGSTDPGVRQIVEKLLHEAGAGGIDYVIVQSLDRLARRPHELAGIVRRLAAAGVRLVTTAAPAKALLQDVSLFCLIAATDNERRHV